MVPTLAQKPEGGQRTVDAKLCVDELVQMLKVKGVSTLAWSFFFFFPILNVILMPCILSLVFPFLALVLKTVEKPSSTSYVG